MPVVGDIFDVFSKANTRNMQIVENHVQLPATTPAKTDKLFIGLLIIGLLGFAITVGFITVAIWNFVIKSF